MPLKTDELVKKATTTTTTLSSLIPKIWAARVERNLRKHAVFEPSVLTFNELLVPGAGDTLYVPLLPDLGPVGSLTEGTDMTVNALTTASSVAYVPVEYGTAIEITRKALDRIKYDGIAETTDRLSYAMSQAIQIAFASLYNASVPGTSNKMTQVYANGKASGTITAADTFNDQLILNGIKTLEQSNNFPFPDGYYILYINPAQYANLLQDTNTRQDLRWAAPDRLINGEKGALHGVRIVVTNYIQTATENSLTVNKAILTAPRWSAIAWKRRPEVVIDPTVYDMGRRRRFGIVADFDIELLHNERAVCLTSYDV